MKQTFLPVMQREADAGFDGIKNNLPMLSAEQIWDKHFKDFTMAGQIKTHALPAMEEYAQQFNPIPTEGKQMRWVDKINARIKYLWEQDRIAVSELDNLQIGSLERNAKWDFIRELSFRKGELVMLLKVLDEPETTHK